MKIQIIPLLFVLFVGGCFHISPEDNAVMAPLGALPEIVKAATAFRLEQRRWPHTKDELQEGFGRGEEKSQFLSQIQSVEIVDESPGSIFYRCKFIRGGSTEIRVNLNEQPNQAPGPTTTSAVPRAVRPGAVASSAHSAPWLPGPSIGFPRSLVSNPKPCRCRSSHAWLVQQIHEH